MPRLGVVGVVVLVLDAQIKALIFAALGDKVMFVDFAPALDVFECAGVGANNFNLFVCAQLAHGLL